MSILAVNFDNLESVPQTEFAGKTAFAGHDIVIVNLDDLGKPFKKSSDFTDNDILTKEAGERFERVLSQRREEATEFLENGGFIVYFLAARNEVRSVAPDQSKAQKGYISLQLHRVDSACPITFELTSGGGRGTNLECRVPGAFQNFFDSVGEMFEYDSYLNASDRRAQKVYFVKGTPRTVGIYVPVGNGHVVLMPRPNFYRHCDPDGEPIGNPWRDYLNALRHLRDALQASHSDVKLPSWVDSYRLPGENDLLERRAVLERELSMVRHGIEAVDNSLSSLRARKVMFAGYDKPLEVAVGQCFEMLGCRVEPGPKAKDDLFVRFGTRLATVEVKGLTKSAREENVRQLIGWVNAYNDGKGKRPKGILIVNGFRNTPLTKRSEPVFPHSLLHLATINEFCLISSLQLLGLTLDCAGNKAKSKAAMETMFSTVGVFESFREWLPTEADK